MAKFSDRAVSPAVRDAIWKEFCRIVSGLKTSDEVQRFLSDLLNRQERLMLARRLQVAALLEAGLTYDEIMRALKVGRTTIARVQRWLHFGRDGYKRAIRLLGVHDRKVLKEKFGSYYHR